MTKWHISENGNPGKCSANVRECPLGGGHFNTAEAAAKITKANFKNIMILLRN